MKTTDKNRETFNPWVPVTFLVPITFREYCNGRLRRAIDDDEWLDNYEHFEEQFYSDYLTDMGEHGYDPECGID